MKFLQVLLVLFFVLSLLFPAKAQKGIESGTPFGLGEDSVTCVENLRMFTTYAKNGAFKEAAEFWEKVYAECPASSRNIYLYGVEIIKKQIEEEKDPAKRDALIDRLMEVYDNRMLPYLLDIGKQIARLHILSERRNRCPYGLWLVERVCIWTKRGILS